MEKNVWSFLVEKMGSPLVMVIKMIRFIGLSRSVFFHGEEPQLSKDKELCPASVSVCVLELFSVRRPNSSPRWTKEDRPTAEGIRSASGSVLSKLFALIWRSPLSQDGRPRPVTSVLDLDKILFWLILVQKLLLIIAGYLSLLTWQRHNLWLINVLSFCFPRDFEMITVILGATVFL